MLPYNLYHTFFLTAIVHLFLYIPRIVDHGRFTWLIVELVSSVDYVMLVVIGQAVTGVPANDGQAINDWTNDDGWRQAPDGDDWWW